MSGINTILKSEEEAKRVVADAVEAGRRLEADALVFQKKTLEAEKIHLAKIRGEKIEAQKDKLKSTYQDIITQGKVRVQAIERATQKKLNRVIDFISKEF